jgi:hypothetical protein
MTDDPLTDLRTALVGAASERARPRRGRRPLLLAVAATVVLVPAAVAATGIVGGGDPTQGRLPDGSTFRVTTAPDPRGQGACQRVEFRHADGRLLGSTLSCPAHDGPAADGTLATGFTAVDGPVVLLLGLTPRATASVEVPNAIGEVTFDPRIFRYAAQVPDDEPMLAIARDADGRELARFSAPAMEPRR